jgi:hypothetical protein
MTERDPLAGHIRHLLDDATSDAPTPPAMPFETVVAPAPSMHQRRRRPWWIVVSAAALLIGVVAGLAALTGRDGTSRSNFEEPHATATAPASTSTWCSVLPALTPSQIEATIRVDIAGAGTCTDGFAGTLTLINSSGDTCTSDIMANLAPTGDRLWFASTSGNGGATGRWEPLPDDLVEGAGVMEYPNGVRSWPIQLPPLEPGTYSLTLGSGITCTTSARFEATFEISAAPDAPPPSESCDTAPLATGRPTPDEATPWTLDGCDVSGEVLLDRPGPAHCAWDSARVIVIGWPIGTSYTSANVPDLEYVRDPLDVFKLRTQYEQLDQLPDGVVDTGYRRQSTELWMNQVDPSSIYLVDDTSIERWPLAVPPLCA